MMRARRSREQWREILEQQRASGLTAAAFCRRRHISHASFFAWRRKLRDVVTFAEVKITPAPVADGSGLELCLPGRRSILVRPGFDPQTLHALLAVLEAGG